MPNIREIRRNKHMTLAELAALIGVRPATISRYEMGKRELSVKTALQIADALGVTIDELLRPTEKTA